MPTIRTRFLKVKDEPGNENISTLDCFGRAVIGQGYNERALRRAFHRLVDKSDYDKTEEREIINRLLKLTITAL